MGKITTYTVSIDRDKAGKRLDRVLADYLPILSRSRIKALMESGCVSSGDGLLVTDPAAKANFGEIMVLKLPPPLQAKPIPQNIPLDIIYEDKHLIVMSVLVEQYLIMHFRLFRRVALIVECIPRFRRTIRVLRLPMCSQQV